MASRKIHTNIRDLGIPSLTTFSHKLDNGIARSMVTTTVHMWDTKKKRSKVIARETVGRIENGQAFGRIAFKEDFIERYPILREVTVMRIGRYEYGYVKTPMPKDLTYDSLTLKRGPKFKTAAAQAAAARPADKAPAQPATPTAPKASSKSAEPEVAPAKATTKAKAATKTKATAKSAEPEVAPAKATAKVKAATKTKASAKADEPEVVSAQATTKESRD